MSNTPITELNEFFPVPDGKPKVVRGVQARFVQPGDTPEQSAARQEESMKRVKEKMAGLE